MIILNGILDISHQGNIIIWNWIFLEENTIQNLGTRKKQFKQYLRDECTEYFTGESLLAYAWPAIFLDFVQTQTDWEILELHSKIVWKYTDCLRKMVNSKYMFSHGTHYIWPQILKAY